MKTNLKPLWYGVFFLCTQYLSAQKEEIWKGTTVFEFNEPYESITINYDDEEFVFKVTDKTKFLIGKKQKVSKDRISLGSTVDVAIVIENRKRILTKVLLSKDEYGEIKKFAGVIDSYKGDTAVIDGRRVVLTDKTIIKCDGRPGCACSKGRTFLGFDELELGSFLTVFGELNGEGVYMASKIEVCKNTYGKVDEEFMLNLSKDFDASNLNQFKSVPANVFKAANGLHNGTIKMGDLEYKLLDDIRVQGYVNMVGHRILPDYAKEERFSEKHGVIFRFYVIENHIPNASAFPNGMVFIHTGLLNIMENEAQLAAVLGHEVAHVTYEHGIKEYKTTRITNSNLGQKTSKWLKKAFTKKMNVNEGTLGGKALASALEHTTPRTVMSLFNKKRETQADRAGLYYMSEAGYDPREAASFWEIMMENTGNQKFMSKLFTSTFTMVNTLQTDLSQTNYSDLGKDGINVLVSNILDTIYTSHPLAVKRLGAINNVLSTTYKDTDFSQLEAGKGSFDKHIKKLKE